MKVVLCVLACLAAGSVPANASATVRPSPPTGHLRQLLEAGGFHYYGGFIEGGVTVYAAKWDSSDRRHGRVRMVYTLPTHERALSFASLINDDAYLRQSIARDFQGKDPCCVRFVGRVQVWTRYAFVLLALEPQ